MKRIATLACLYACAPTAAHPPPAAPVAARSAPTLIVGRRDGIVEVDLDGHVVRRFGHARADWVGKLSGGRFVTLSDGTVRLVDPASGREDVVGTVPTTVTCVRSGESQSYGLHPQGDSAVSATDQRLEVLLADYDYDASIEVSVTMCLDHGAVYVANLDPACELSGVHREPPPCVETSAAAEPSEGSAPREVPPLVATARYPYVLADNRIVHDAGGVRDGAGVTLFGGAEPPMRVASVSPSGRWALLTGPEFTASSFYYLYLLLDRTTGALYPVQTRTAQWPAPLTDAVLRERLDPEAGKTPDAWVSYTETIGWVTGANADVLRVGSLLIHAGTHVVDLGGTPVP